MNQKPSIVHRLTLGITLLLADDVGFVTSALQQLSVVAPSLRLELWDLICSRAGTQGKAYCRILLRGCHIEEGREGTFTTLGQILLEKELLKQSIKREHALKLKQCIPG